MCAEGLRRRRIRQRPRVYGVSYGIGVWAIFGVRYVYFCGKGTLRGKKYGVGNVGKESTLMIEIVEKVE